MSGIHKETFEVHFLEIVKLESIFSFVHTLSESMGKVACDVALRSAIAEYYPSNHLQW